MTFWGLIGFVILTLAIVLIMALLFESDQDERATRLNLRDGEVFPK